MFIRRPVFFGCLPFLCLAGALLWLAGSSTLVTGSRPESIPMVAPVGVMPERDLSYSEVNVNNAEANKLNAEANKFNAQATAVIVQSEAQATKTVSQAHAVEPMYIPNQIMGAYRNAGLIVVTTILVFVIGFLILAKR